MGPVNNAKSVLFGFTQATAKDMSVTSAVKGEVICMEKLCKTG